MELASAPLTSFCREEALSGSSDHVQEDEGWPRGDTCGSNLSCCRFSSAAGAERTWKLEGTQQLSPGDVGLGGGRLSGDSCSKADIREVLEAENSSPSAGKYADSSVCGPKRQLSHKAEFPFHTLQDRSLCCAVQPRQLCDGARRCLMLLERAGPDLPGVRLPRTSPCRGSRKQPSAWKIKFW